ncbi:MAG: insulinase family protein [Alphaproteobacteria bacterium]|nr:insulinase family protein [Alphaproteobacteria bacterium]
MAQHQQLHDKMNISLSLKSVAHLVAALFLFFICSMQLAAAKIFDAKSFTLDNGLEVIVVENPRVPVVTHMIWYKVGAADEQAGFSGMAHYLEHLLFKGTEKVVPGDFSKTVKQNGGNDNAFTSQDYTAYFQSIPSDHLEKMMEMETDRMLNAAPPPEHYASEKNVVLEERRQNTENDPRALFNEQMRSVMFPNHPYGTPVIGWMDEIKTYEWNDVKKFYDTWYAPNNAFLVVSGDVTVEEVKELAEKTYGRLSQKELPKRVRPVLPPSIAQTNLTLEHERIHQPAFQRGYLAQSYAQNREDALALDVLQEILSGGATTRFYKSLVVEKKLAISAGFSYSGNSKDYASAWVYGTPAQGVSLDTLKDAIEAELTNVIENGVSEQEVTNAITRIQDSAVFARDSLSGPAMIIGRSLTTGSSLEEIENWPDDIASITAKKVQDVAIKYLDINAPWHRAPVSGYLLPKEKEEATE